MNDYVRYNEEYLENIRESIQEDWGERVNCINKSFESLKNVRRVFRDRDLIISKWEKRKLKRLTNVENANKKRERL